MDARLFLKSLIFFPKKKAKIVESRALIQMLKEIQKKARSTVNTTGQEGEAQ